MSFIRTLLKDINPDDLGITNSHEHLVCCPPYWVEKKADDLLLDDIDKSLADVLDFKNNGGQSIVEATAIDYGRDVLAVAEIAKKANIHIIGTAGFNKSFLWSAKIPTRLKKITGDYETFTDMIEQSSIEDLVEMVRKEVEIGLEGTEYKAGQVKFGTGYNSITPLEIKTLKVAAIVHKLTGSPMHTHTEAGTMGLEQAELLIKEGIDLRKVSFGHMDRNLDPYYHKQMAATGAFLSFDGLGKNKYGPESNRIEAIINLIKSGHTNQILLGGDTARKSYYKSYGYGLGLEWILKKWIPRFIDECNQEGLDSNHIIKRLLIENPKNYLTFGKAENV